MNSTPPTSSSIPQVTSRQTKGEIFEAYKTLLEQHKQNLKQISERQKQQKKEDEQKVIKKTTTYTIDQITKNLEEVKGQVSTTLDSLATQLIRETNKLAEIQKAIEIKQKQLEETYNIEVAGETLTQLIQAQEETKRQSQVQEEERKIQLSLIRKREEMEHQIKQEEREREFEKKMQSKIAELATREEVVKKQEDELVELHKKVDNFPKQLEEVIKKTKQETLEKVEKEAQVKASLLAEKVVGERKVAELRISSLETKVAEQKQEIEILQRQLGEAMQRNQELASRVIEGASGARLLTEKLNEERKEKREEKKE